ncbi:MAG: XdhC family protein, partial [Tepidiformaceae bacterium]
MLELTQRLVLAAEGGDPVVLASVLEAGGLAIEPGSRMLVERSGGRLGTLGDARLDELVASYAAGSFERHA